jgi:hypothetical protein
MMPIRGDIRLLASLRAVAWCAACLCLGCDRGAYEIEMQVKGDAVHREITFWRQGTGDGAQRTTVPPAELAQIAALYHAETPKAAADKFHFAGDFTGGMPADVGGSGWFSTLPSPMGTLKAYVERFRGKDDLSADLDQRLKSMDRIVDLAAEFLKVQVKKPADAAQLNGFIEKHLRRDLRNLCLYVWAGGVAGHYDEKADEEIGVRIAQYLIERDYLRTPEAPQLLQAFIDAGDEDYGPMLEIVQRVVARKTGVPDSEPVPAFLVELCANERLGATIEEFAEKTPEYKKLLTKWEEAKKTYPDQQKPKPDEVFMDLATEAFWPGIAFFEAADSLSVRLKTPHAPEFTNGKWDAESGTLQWSKRLSGKAEEDREFPSVLYAFWTEPDDAYQAKHFGKTAISADALCEYCLWYRALSKEQTAAWDAFVDGLKPGPELADQIKRFHFSGEPAIQDLDSPPYSRANTAKSILLQELVGQAWPPQQESPGAALPGLPLPNKPEPPKTAPSPDSGSSNKQ